MWFLSRNKNPNSAIPKDKITLIYNSLSPRKDFMKTNVYIKYRNFFYIKVRENTIFIKEKKLNNIIIKFSFKLINLFKKYLSVDFMLFKDVKMTITNMRVMNETNIGAFT